LRPGQIETIAGTGEASNYADDGGDPGDGRAARDALLGWPSAIDVGPDGTLYVADRSNGNLRVVSTDGVIDTLTDAILPPAGLLDDRRPTAVAVSDDGTLYVSDDYVVRRMDPASGEFTTVAGGGRATFMDGGDGGDGGPATEVRLRRITGLAVSDGTVYVAHQGARFNWRIRAIDDAGTVTTVAGGGELELGASEGQAATEARLSEVTSIAADSLGNVYFGEWVVEGPQADGTYASKGHRIRKIDTDGTISTVLGEAGRGFSGDGGPAADAESTINDDLALTVDAADRLLFVDGSNGDNKVVRRIDGDGTITTVAPTWYVASDIAIGPDGNLYQAAPGRIVMMALNEDGLPVDRETGDADAAQPALGEDPWVDEAPGTVLTVAGWDPAEVAGEATGLTVGSDGTIHVVGSGDDSVLTIADMASELRFDRSTVYRWIAVGKGPKVFRSPGGHIRVFRRDFIEWAQENRLLPPRE
jgi:hypothetical protein